MAVDECSDLACVSLHAHVLRYAFPDIDVILKLQYHLIGELELRQGEHGCLQRWTSHEARWSQSTKKIDEMIRREGLVLNRTFLVFLTRFIAPCIGENDQRHQWMDFGVNERMLFVSIIFADHER